MAITLKQKELAELVGLTDRHIRRIDQTLEPEEKLLVKAEDGRFDAGIFVQRYIEMKVREATDGMDDLDAVKARHEIVKTEKTQLEVARMRGELLDWREVQRAWNDISNTVMNTLLTLPGQLAPMIRGMESVEMISGILDGEIRRALERIADTPAPAWATEETGEETEEGE